MSPTFITLPQHEDWHTDFLYNTATFTIAHIGLLVNINCQSAKQNSIDYEVTYIKPTSSIKTPLYSSEEQPQILAGSVARHCSSEGTWIIGMFPVTTNVKIRSFTKVIAPKYLVILSC